MQDPMTHLVHKSVRSESHHTLLHTSPLFHPATRLQTPFVDALDGTMQVHGKRICADRSTSFSNTVRWAVVDLAKQRKMRLKLIMQDHHTSTIGRQINPCNQTMANVLFENLCMTLPRIRAQDRISPLSPKTLHAGLPLFSAIDDHDFRSHDSQEQRRLTWRHQMRHLRHRHCRTNQYLTPRRSQYSSKAKKLARVFRPLRKTNRLTPIASKVGTDWHVKHNPCGDSDKWSH